MFLVWYLLCLAVCLMAEHMAGQEGWMWEEASSLRPSLIRREESSWLYHLLSITLAIKLGHLDLGGRSFKPWQAASIQMPCVESSCRSVS